MLNELQSKHGLKIPLDIATFLPSNRAMKAKHILILTATLILASPLSTRASEANGPAIVVDVLIARPAGLAATALGSAFFVLALPFAAMTGGIDDAAEALVAAPARATFTRPLGDFDLLMSE